jgi:hypothetical protein
MKTLVMAAATLAVLASPAAALAAPATGANTNVKAASAARSGAPKLTRTETRCIDSARAKYKAGEMRKRAEAKCTTSTHASYHKASQPASRQSRKS